MLKPFSFPSFVGSHQLPDYGLKYYLSQRRLMQHEGLEVKQEDRIYVITFDSDSTHPKEVIILRPSDMLGSMGARHYYGELILPKVNYREKNGRRTLPWLDGKTLLQKVELHTKIDQEEIMNFPQRFKAYKAGDNFNGFLTEEELKKRAIEFSREYFPGFRLACSRNEYSSRPIAENEWLIKDKIVLKRPKAKPRKIKEPSKQIELL